MNIKHLPGRHNQKTHATRSKAKIAKDIISDWLTANGHFNASDAVADYMYHNLGSSLFKNATNITNLLALISADDDLNLDFETTHNGSILNTILIDDIENVGIPTPLYIGIDDDGGDALQLSYTTLLPRGILAVPFSKQVPLIRKLTYMAKTAGFDRFRLLQPTGGGLDPDEVIKTTGLHPQARINKDWAAADTIERAMMYLDENYGIKYDEDDVLKVIDQLPNKVVLENDDLLQIKHPNRPSLSLFSEYLIHSPYVTFYRDFKKA